MQSADLSQLGTLYTESNKGISENRTHSIWNVFRKRSPEKIVIVPSRRPPSRRRSTLVGGVRVEDDDLLSLANTLVSWQIQKIGGERPISEITTFDLTDEDLSICSEEENVEATEEYLKMEGDFIKKTTKLARQMTDLNREYSEKINDYENKITDMELEISRLKEENATLKSIVDKSTGRFQHGSDGGRGNLAPILDVCEEEEEVEEEAVLEP